VHPLIGDLQQGTRVLSIPTEHDYEACFAASIFGCSAQTCGRVGNLRTGSRSVHKKEQVHPDKSESAFFNSAFSSR
jgi:hypothetical protein